MPIKNILKCELSNEIDIIDVISLMFVCFKITCHGNTHLCELNFFELEYKREEKKNHHTVLCSVIDNPCPFRCDREGEKCVNLFKEIKEHKARRI